MTETQQTRRHKKGGPYKPEERERLKAAYLEKLIECGCVQEAARKAIGGVDQATIKGWRAKDPAFDAACDEADAVAVGKATSLLWESMKAGNATAIIFYLKTRGSKYGFKENQQIDLNGALAEIPRGFNGIGEK